MKRAKLWDTLQFRGARDEKLSKKLDLFRKARM